MTPEEKENALRAQARRCAEEITKAMSVKPRPKWNAVCPPHPSQALREGKADGCQPGEICQCYWPHEQKVWSGIMSKSLNARCIRRWEVEFRPFCDSKVNPYWRKRDLRGYIREAALTTAYSMVESMAERNAKVDYDGAPNSWSYEFSLWYRLRRGKYLKEARDYLNEEATNDEIDDEIENELEAWND